MKGERVLAVPCPQSCASRRSLRQAQGAVVDLVTALVGVTGEHQWRLAAHRRCHRRFVSEDHVDRVIGGVERG